MWKGKLSAELPKFRERIQHRVMLGSGTPSQANQLAVRVWVKLDPHRMATIPHASYF